MRMGREKLSCAGRTSCRDISRTRRRRSIASATAGFTRGTSVTSTGTATCTSPTAWSADADRTMYRMVVRGTASPAVPPPSSTWTEPSSTPRSYTTTPFTGPGVIPFPGACSGPWAFCRRSSITWCWTKSAEAVSTRSSTGNTGVSSAVSAYPAANASSTKSFGRACSPAPWNAFGSISKEASAWSWSPDPSILSWNPSRSTPRPTISSPCP